MGAISIYSNSSSPVEERQLIMKKIIILICVLLISISMVFANGEGSHDGEDDGFSDDDGHDEMLQEMVAEHSMHEGSGMSHQLQMILPFSHFAEKHWFAGIMLVLMWLALVYAGYDLFAKKKK